MTAEELTTAKTATAEKNRTEEAKTNEGASDEAPAAEAEPPAARGASAAEGASSDDGSDGDEDLTDDAKAKKRKERLEQNRISARESRKRKKTMIEELQRTVITLSRENKDLNDRNDQLRTQLMEIGTNYPNVVPIQAIMNGAPPPTSQVPPSIGAAQVPTPHQLHQHQQAAAVAAAAQATFNPLAYWQQHQQVAMQASSAPAPAMPIPTVAAPAPKVPEGHNSTSV